MLTIPRKVIIDKVIDKINDSAIYKKLGVTKKAGTTFVFIVIPKLLA